jgi:hypothetical protein
MLEAKFPAATTRFAPDVFRPHRRVPLNILENATANSDKAAFT